MYVVLLSEPALILPTPGIYTVDVLSSKVKMNWMVFNCADAYGADRIRRNKPMSSDMGSNVLFI